MIQTLGKTTSGTHNSSAYIELLNAFPPRPITSEEELDATQKVINSLIDKASLTDDERAYLSVLGSLVYEYEEIHYPMNDIHGVELLKVLMAEENVTNQDLIPIFETESNLSQVLNGERELTITNLEKLAAFFHVSSAAFLKESN